MMERHKQNKYNTTECNKGHCGFDAPLGIIYGGLKLNSCKKLHPHASEIKTRATIFDGIKQLAFII